MAASYAHRGRVVFAEGLLRKAAEQLQLSPDREDNAQEHSIDLREATLSERSKQAFVAWSLGQLYAVVPKRETEAQRWQQLGQERWPFASPGSQAIPAQLGGVRALAGEQSPKTPAVVSFLLQRVFMGA